MDHKNDKKKLIFSSYDTIGNPYYAGGGAIAVHEVAKRLTHYFDITVISGNYPGAKDERIDTVMYKHIGPKRAGPKLGQVIYQCLLPLILYHYPYDLWIESFTPPFSTAFLPLFTKKPVIGLVHMLASSDMERKYKLPFHLIENIGLKTYPIIIVTSPTFKQKIEQVNPTSEIDIIPNGINLPPQSVSTNTKPYILYLGRIEYDQKGIDLLLDAFSSIKNHTDVNLVIAGPGDQQNLRKLKEHIQKSNLSDRITLIGRVMGEQKEILLRTCRGVVIPSRFETFSMVALEAIAYSKPIVSFNIDGLQWIPPQLAIKTTPFDSYEFGENLLAILQNHHLQKDISQYSQQIIKNYTWEEIVYRYQLLINAVLHI